MISLFLLSINNCKMLIHRVIKAHPSPRPNNSYTFLSKCISREKPYRPPQRGALKYPPSPTKSSAIRALFLFCICPHLALFLHISSFLSICRDFCQQNSTPPPATPQPTTIPGMQRRSLTSTIPRPQIYHNFLDITF